MRSHNRRRPGIFRRKHPGAIRGFALILALFAVVRIAASLGADGAAEALIADFLQEEDAVVRLLNFELGLGGGDLLTAAAPQNTDAAEGAAPSSAPSPSPKAAAPAPAPPEEALPYYTPPVEGTIPFSEESKPSGSAKIQIKNSSKYDPDINALLNAPLNISLKADEPAVLIIHTHGSEAYTPDGDDQYVASDPYRTQNPDYSILRVGEALKEALESRGISVIHDTGIYDYPSYSGSYGRSLAAMRGHVEKHPSIGLVIDLHRDAIGDSSGKQYRTIAQIGDETCAQVMFVMGTDTTGLEHPKWQENLKLALRLQQEMDTLYPTLTRPIRLSENRYNQQVTTGSMILEVGCTGNTLKESLSAVRYFADAAANVLLDLYK